jgi:exonuclease III
MEKLSDISGPGGDARSRARALFHARSALHLGESYSSVGDIPNLSSTYHSNASATNGKNILTRIITWNVGGADGTLADPVKLEFLCNTMLLQGIHIALITESHADVASVKQKLRELHLHAKFRVRGQGKLLAWLIRTDTADRIVQDPSLSCGRISGIVLAGACQTRTLIIGLYGISGASTDHHCSRAQQELLASLVPTITDNQKLKHHIIVLGDFNVTPGHAWSTSASSLSASISHLESWRSILGLTNALLERTPAARLASPS